MKTFGVTDYKKLGIPKVLWMDKNVQVQNPSKMKKMKGAQNSRCTSSICEQS